MNRSAMNLSGVQTTGRVLILIILVTLFSVAGALPVYAAVKTFAGADIFPIPIPETVGGTNSTIFILPGKCSRIVDVNVSVQATHTWVGDLKFTLTHNDTGSSAVLIDRPGVPATAFGCGGDNISALLDDEAGSPVESQCAATPPAISGAFTPNSPLSVFDNENAAGTWTLNAWDAATGDTGQLTGWNLIITCADTNELNAVAPVPVSQDLMGMPYGTAAFGPVFVPVQINDYFYIPSGSVDPANLLGCNVWPAGTFTNKVAVIKRGTCEFNTKVQNAQNAGALAVVIYNTEAGGDSVTNMGGANPTITIPSVFIGNTNGIGLVNWYGTNGTASQLQIIYAGYAPTVTTDPATAITNTSATLNASVNPNAMSTDVNFDYGPTTTYGTTIAATPATVTGATPTGVSAAISGLSPNTKYYYRVNATNFFGTSYGGGIFITDMNGNYPSADIFPIAIPDNNPVGVTSTVAVSADACPSIMDLNVVLQATHTWVGDLIFTLTHNNTGTSAVIIDRPKVPASPLGCSGDNIDAVLDDEAALPVEDQCSGTPPAIGGTFTPNNPLSVFGDEDATGIWTLKAVDAAGGDTGQIIGWSLNLTCGYRLDVAVNTGSGSGTVTSAPAGINCGPICSATFPRDTPVSLSAVPSEDSYFSAWTGVCIGNSQPCPVAMSAHRSVAAVFEPVADFTYTMDPVSGNAPVAVSFAGSVIPGTTAWSWAFGDGESGTGQSPLHNFSTAGVWSVTLTITKDGSSFGKTKNVTTNACGDPYPQMIPGKDYFPTVQGAYSSASSGDVILIQAKDINVGTLSLNRSIPVTLEGGYNCGFSSNLFFTTLFNSSVIVSGGAVTVENIVIE
ncbi:MAG: PA domain-containing protein [Thermodesulfovibrionales bacterium]